MNNKTTYKWVVEPVDKYDDIIDPLFWDSYSDAVECWRDAFNQFPEARKVFIALVQNIGNDIDGLQDRGYAYISDENGKLPEYFDNDRAVPKKYQDKIYLLPRRF